MTCSDRRSTLASEPANVVPVCESLVGADEAAKFLDVSVSTVKRMAERGEIPGMKIGRNWKFRISLLEAWSTEKLLSRCSQGLRE